MGDTINFFPYCIIDGEIEYPKIDEKKHYYCDKGETFYALVPNYTPIPTSMSVICVEKKDGKSIDVRFERDPNMVNLENCVAFITWSRKVPNTVPLYFYRYGDKLEYVRASFKEENQPKDSSFSSVYVLRDADINFTCYQNYKCIPTKEKGYDRIIDCIANCNQNNPQNMFEYNIKDSNYRKYEYIKNKNFFSSINKNLPFIYSLLALTILFLSMLFLYIRSVGKKMK